MIRALSIHAFEDSREQATALAAALGAPIRPIDVHIFPDGESLVTATDSAEVAVVYRPLHQPNAKLVEVMLAASALRDGGAKKLVLVAPYLPYMRQDIAFATGQAVSQKVVGKTLGVWFDAVVAVAPHLHRTPSLSAVFPNHATATVQPIDAMAWLLSHEPDANRVLIAPDVEAQRMVQALAERVGARYGSALKHRRGDTEVDVALSGAASVNGRNAIIVDDMISTGYTLIATARALLAAGARTVEALVGHALFSEESGRAMAVAGISRIRSCDGVPHPTNAVSLADSLAPAVLKVTQSLAVGPPYGPDVGLDRFDPPLV